MPITDGYRAGPKDTQATAGPRPERARDPTSTRRPSRLSLYSQWRLLFLRAHSAQAYRFTHFPDEGRPEWGERARIQQGVDRFRGTGAASGEPLARHLGGRAGRELLAHPPEFSHRQLSVRTAQELFEMEFAFSPRGRKETVA